MNRVVVGDQVEVISGNHKGEKGKVARIDHERGRVIIEGVNLVKRHMRATQETAGGIVQVPSAVSLSNVMLVDPESGKPTRVRMEERDGKKVRVAVKSGAVLTVEKAQS